MTFHDHDPFQTRTIHRESATLDSSCRSDLNVSDLGSEAIAALRAGFGVACRIAMTHGDKLPHQHHWVFPTYKKAPPQNHHPNGVSVHFGYQCIGQY